MTKKVKIYLCDLVHSYLGTGTNMFPLNIGYVGAFAKNSFPKDIDIKLFKYPENFIKQFKKEPPHIVGFSNYTWNADLNNRISKWIKSISPKTIIVFGGPNINYSPRGYKRFFTTHDSTDFYVPYQGETPFVNLLKEIFIEDLDLPSLKSKPIDGVLSYNKNSKLVIQGKAVPRITNLDTVPSPYLTGLLDKFFDTNLIPIMETNRGCPYTCTYCCQGFSSHNQLEAFNIERVKDELKYIALRVKSTNILLFADANFGILPRDIEIAKYAVKLREKTNYPHKISVNWAKNQPKIFKISKMFKNTLLIISLQSLNKTVLKNIKRYNIKMSIFKDVINKVNKEGNISGTELILGLPGETKKSHFQTLKKLFDWNVSYILCYNALILDGSELSLMKESGKFKCKTKFRLIDNSFGKYDNIISFEAEEGIRSSATMQEDEILYFRPIHWLIHFLWNYRFYYDLLKYLQFLKVNPSDFIVQLIDKIDSAPKKIKEIFYEFKEKARKEWFDSPGTLRRYYSQPERFEWLSKGNYGKMNNLYTFKILLEAREEFEDYLYQTAINCSSVCKSKKLIIKEVLKYLSTAIIDFNQNWYEISKEKSVPCKYNILEWKKSKYQKNLEEFSVPKKGKFLFYLPKKQKQSLETVLKQYKHSNKNVSLRKMSEYMDITDIRRAVKIII